ncbi:hypothetical protein CAUPRSCDRAFT_12699 [Caulochytrium protostelioides]|uniref:Transcriptional regulatory protein RXT2 N-terminal domain-containing protein n=1 Tax=Caulochytrium protostelioides TaxID=1555241 RepID=A0A4P9WSJ0_9FUNG|nr:hypothetical protein CAUPRSCDRAFT_12699 [Caulochytrium protostelioides]
MVDSQNVAEFSLACWCCPPLTIVPLDADDVTIPGSRPFNRGNKVKRSAKDFHHQASSKPMLWAQSYIQEDIQFGRVGRKRAVVRKLGVAQSDDDPYKDIHIHQIWATADRPEAMKHHPSTVRVLQSRYLTLLAQDISYRIEEEKQHQNLLSRMLRLLHGDNPLVDTAPLLAECGGEGPVRAMRAALVTQIGVSAEVIDKLGRMRVYLCKAHEQKVLIAERIVALDDVADDGQGGAASAAMPAAGAATPGSAGPS